MKFVDISWNLLTFHEICRHFMKFVDISWNLLTFAEFNGDLMRYDGRLWQAIINNIFCENIYQLCVFLAINNQSIHLGAGEDPGSVKLPTSDVEFYSVYFLLECSSPVSFHLLNFSCLRWNMLFYTSSTTRLLLAFSWIKDVLLILPG